MKVAASVQVLSWVLLSWQIHTNVIATEVCTSSSSTTSVSNLDAIPTLSAEAMFIDERIMSQKIRAIEERLSAEVRDSIRRIETQMEHMVVAVELLVMLALLTYIYSCCKGAITIFSYCFLSGSADEGDSQYYPTVTRSSNQSSFASTSEVLSDHTDFESEDRALSEETPIVAAVSSRRLSKQCDPILLVKQQGIQLLSLYLRGKCTLGKKLEWKEKLNKQGITVSTCSVSGSDWQALKARCSIQTDPRTIGRLVIDDNKIGSYDELFDRCERLATVDDQTSIRRIRFKGVWPTTPREFVTLTTYYEEPDGTGYIVSKSVEDDYCPATGDYVRGKIVLIGYKMKVNAKNPRWTDVTLVAHTELRGSVPSYCVNMLLSTAPFKILSSIRRITAKK